jgi:hypothetical protein
MTALFAILFVTGQQYALAVVVAGVFFGSLCDQSPKIQINVYHWVRTIAWVAFYITVGINIHWYAAIVLQCAYDYKMYATDTRDNISYNRAWMYIIAIFWGETIEKYTAIILGVSVVHLAWIWYRKK